MTFVPTALVGVYLSRVPRPARDGQPPLAVTYLRFAFSGELGRFFPERRLDHGIVRTVWMTPRRSVPAPTAIAARCCCSAWRTTWPVSVIRCRCCTPTWGVVSRQRIVGLSGGVDSAVTAWLLKQQGHEVVGIFMKNWEDDDDSEYCSSNIDFVDAAAVADVIGIEIEHVNFAAEYKDRVFAEFLREYQAGRTPNPTSCATPRSSSRPSWTTRCAWAPTHIATGHYARVR
jgi:hypothetical protein